MLMLIIILSLLLIGLALIVVELMFIPGTTIVGLLGAIFAIAGVVISYKHFGKEVGLYVLLATSVLTLATLVYSFRSGSWSKFSLKSSSDSRVNEGMMASLNVGDTGKAVSTLRPFGKGEFGDSQYEVKTSGDYVETGTQIRITHIHSHQIIVEPLIKL